MQYYGGENTFIKHQDDICQEGQVISCLADGAGRTDRRDMEGEPRLLTLPIHNNNRRTNKQQAYNGAMHNHDDMSSLCKDIII